MNANSLKALEFDRVRALLLQQAGSAEGIARLEALRPSSDPGSVREALARTGREGGRVAVLCLDLDRCKDINDTLGHDAGDRLLMEAAGRFRDCLREEDTIARLGGDEFAVILPHVEGVHDACRIAERLQSSLKEPFEISGREHYAGLSMGVAFFPGDGKDPQTLLSSADIALYRAKEAGRNNFQIFTADMDRTVREHAELEVALRSAIDKKEFVLHFQPQVDLATGRASCLEALVRWDRPGTGLVPPDKFIPVAEDTRLIIPLGEWVLKEACLNCAGWGDGVRVAVNLSARQFQQKDLAWQVEQALKDAGLAPDRLELEITESALMRDVDTAVKTLTRIDQMGVRISIDDFGIGYSSFSYIKKFPLHILKIDRTFIKNVTTDKNDAAISSAIVAMAHALRLRVVAEGVEVGPQMEFLRGIGCDLAQGNLISRPMPPADVEAFLQSRKNTTAA